MNLAQSLAANAVIGAAIVLVTYLIIFNAQERISTVVENKFSELYATNDANHKSLTEYTKTLATALQVTTPTPTAPVTTKPETKVEEKKPEEKKELKKVVSFGLWGGDPKYTFGAIRNAELVKYMFPGWICRFYIDETSVPKEIQDKLVENGSELVNMGGNAGIAGMFWRFLVADDPTVDIYAVRDSDSRLNMRDKAAIDEWIETGVPVHILRDHPNHGYHMNGGMWGGRKGAIQGMKDKIAAWSNKGAYMQDMNFLSAIIWPLVKDIQLAHDSFHCKSFPNARPFPTRRFRYEHVGQVYDSNDDPRWSDVDPFFTKNHPNNPADCRKKPEWNLG